MKYRAWIAASVLSIFATVASAANAADCKALSSKLMDNLDQGNSDAAVADFNAKMKAALSSAQLEQFWQKLPQKLGTRGVREEARLVQKNGNDIVVTPLHFGHSVAHAVVICSPDGQIAGFHVVPQP